MKDIIFDMVSTRWKSRNLVIYTMVYIPFRCRL